MQRVLVVPWSNDATYLAMPLLSLKVQGGARVGAPPAGSMLPLQLAQGQNSFQASAPSTPPMTGPTTGIHE